MISVGCDRSRGERFASSSLLISTMGSDIVHVLVLCLNTIPVKYCPVDFSSINPLYMADDILKPVCVKSLCGRRD